MKRIKFVKNGNELILFSSLKEILVKEGIKITQKKLKKLGYDIVELYPIVFK